MQMFAIDPRTRSVLAGAALIAYAGAFRAGPTTAHDAIAAAPVARSTSPEPVTDSPADVVPRRDPFAGGPPAAAGGQAPPTVAHVALPPIPPALRALPPNAGAGEAFPFGSPERVTAIVTGGRPFALIDDGSTTRLVGSGDLVDGERVVAIDVRGVHLDGGTTLSVANGPLFSQPGAGGRRP